MKFAFLVHPISAESGALLDFDAQQSLQACWGVDPLAVTAQLHAAVQQSKRNAELAAAPQVRVIDELRNLTTDSGGSAEGRLIEIPMDAVSILEDPDRAVAYMEQAVEMAVAWGARLVGLGSMTGVVGGRGTHLAEHSPIAVTTGNSLTVYAALQNLYRACEEFDIDLEHETIAVVGVPGSIASAVASLIAPQCGRLIVVGRQSSGPARKLAEQLGAELLLDVNQALSAARIVITATSTGNCVDQALLQPGSVVIDVGVPTDVRGSAPLRSDALILTGGLVRVPRSMPLESRLLWFQHGMIPSCLGETMVLALENREECLSLGRALDLDAIQDIGSAARAHGFDFSSLYSFGSPLDDSQLARFHKARARMRRGQRRPGELSPTAEQLAARAQLRYERHINPVLVATGRQSGFVKTFVRGEGVHLYDDTGRRYTDFVAGFGALNLGHNHPAVVEAVSTALRSQAPGFAQSAVNPYAAALAHELVAVAPHSLEMAFFCNSGAEAVEAAIKLARASTGRSGILFCEGSYHGKTLGALSVTANPEYRRPFQPLVPGCESVPYGDYTQLQQALATKKFAAMIIEPLQAEGGMLVPPAGYLREVQSLCRATGTLLIADEIQTGMGRTGTLFAVEREGVDPDLLTLAKSLGGGLVPIGAMMCRRDLWLKAYGTVQTFALHTSTFGGGSVACAAGLAALRTLCDEQLEQNAQARGEQLMLGLAPLCQRFACLKEVRGRGLLIGLEFNKLPANILSHWKAIDRTGLMPHLIPNLDRAVESIFVLHAMQTLLQAHEIYTQVSRSNPQVLRIQPPLTITAAEVDEFLRAIEQTCEEIDYAANLVGGMIAKTGVGKHNAAERQAAAPANPLL